MPSIRAALSLLPAQCSIVARTSRFVASSTVVPTGTATLVPFGSGEGFAALAAGANAKSVMVSPVRQRHGALQHMIEFPDVAGPGVRPQLFHRGRRDGANFLAHRVGKNPEKMTGQQRNVLAPLAQRRQDNLHRVDPVIQIVPEFSLRNQSWECPRAWRRAAARRSGFPSCRRAAGTFRPATRAAAWPATAATFRRFHPAAASRRRPARICRAARRRRR